MVYGVFDRVRRGEVALKSLQRMSGGALYQFKREFRSLVDLVHPNLVTCYELVSVDGQWCFTMERIDGVSFLEHVRPHRARFEAQTTGDMGEDDTMTVSPGTNTTQTIMPTDRPSNRSSEPNEARARLRQCIRDGPVDFERLRAALRQLAAGVSALHAMGKLHRDLKPSNVLVESTTSRVVVCDFGLVAEVRTDTGDTAEGAFMGTPSYMSPEQALGAALSPATDWYSVGVMLFEALTGELPFAGAQQDMLDQKIHGEAPDVLELAADAPADLRELCAQLLARDPSRRPGGPAVLEALGVSPPAAVASAQAVPLVARERELDALRDALRASHDDRRAVAVMLHGPSGVGKTAVVRAFLDEFAATGGQLLEGRCYARESVPFKALDSVVDALTTWLGELSADEAARVLPSDLASLERLFPVLRQVPAVADALTRAPVPPIDPQELRRRGFAALRTTLQRLAERGPTVLYIDDVQWGDEDSARFVHGLIHHSAAPPLLLIAGYRDEGANASAFVETLGAEPALGEHRGDVRDIAVEPLSQAEAERLALACLNATGPAAEARAAAIAREAAGNPLFVTELARRGASAPGTEGLTLEDVISLRVDALPPEARGLLVASAIAGRPLAIRLLSRVAGVTDEAQALAKLNAERLVRTRQPRGVDELEPYHDRIRATILARLPGGDTRALHRRLATELERSEYADPHALAEHWLAGGATDRASRCAVDAAREAERALAFHRAAHDYQLALEHGAFDDDERCELQIRLADALANGGRLLEAAKLYLSTAREVDDDRALDLERRAIEQLLCSGKLTEGLALARDVLARVGLELPRGRVSAMASIVARRAWVKVRGLRFRPRPAEEIARRDLRWADVYWSVSASLPFVDPLMGTAFQMRHLHRVLAIGDPTRAALALTMEIGFRGSQGTHERAAVDRLYEMAIELARESGDPFAIGRTIGMRGFVDYMSGRFADSYQSFTHAIEVFADKTDRGRWEIAVGHTYRMSSLLLLGRTAQLVRDVPQLLREAVDRGDLYQASALRAWRPNATWLVLDQPEAAREHAQAGCSVLRGAGSFSLYEYYETLAFVQIDLYRGEARRAWDYVQERWPALRRSPLYNRVQSVRIEAGFLRARAALALAREDAAQRDALLREAGRCVRTLSREGAAWGAAVAELVRAQTAVVRGDDAGALDRFSAAAEACEREDMMLLRAVALLRAGELEGGDEGAARAAAARAWMREEAIVAPDRLAAMYAPISPR